jgi:hypothetical protein
VRLVLLIVSVVQYRQRVPGIRGILGMVGDEARLPPTMLRSELLDAMNQIQPGDLVEPPDTSRAGPPNSPGAGSQSPSIPQYPSCSPIRGRQPQSHERSLRPHRQGQSEKAQEISKRKLGAPESEILEGQRVTRLRVTTATTFRTWAPPAELPCMRSRAE